MNEDMRHQDRGQYRDVSRSEESAVELQMERVALIRGQLGRIRLDVKEALQFCPPGTPTFFILTRALEPQEPGS